MALNAAFVSVLQEKVLPIASDPSNWDTTSLEPYWDRGVAIVQGLLAGNIAKATLDILATAATSTDLAKLLYGGAAAYLLWNRLEGIDEAEAVTRANAELAFVMQLIAEIQSGQRKVYDSTGSEISVTLDGAGSLAWTQTNVEPTIRQARRDSDGNLLGSEEDGSLDQW